MRDAIIYSVATSIFATQLALYALRGVEPNVTWIAAAAFLYGLAPALRADEWLLKNGKQNGKQNGGPSAP